MRAAFRGLVGVAVLLLLWELLSASDLVPPGYIPPPTLVASTLVNLLGDGVFVYDVIASLLAWAIALGIAVVIAVPLGLVLGSVPAVRRATRTVVELLRPVPSVAMIPLAILLFGGGPEAKIVLAVYASVWPILFNTIYALDELDEQLVDTARAFGVSKPRIMATVALPSAAPFVMTGIRTSAAIALIVVVSTELLAGATLGLGQFILNASSGGSRMDLVFAGTVVAGLIGYLVNAGLEWVQRRFFAWGARTGETV
ncbi:ABC transporter permease [Allokutzneria sp. NRRL B-24872]|uniref:ABC transporter permease n=1 Tax=Allokutzneria sp. NRRL B-24872 TaxID=1137961 RepID=UPI000A3C3001|nr:ABC transporter permease [Allokutzneria sp. NRRL B-24872]